MLCALAGVLQAWSLAWPWHAAESLLPYGQPLWWLHLLSLAVLAAQVQRAPSARPAAGLGWIFGTAWLSATFWWLYISMHTYGGLPAPLAALAVLALAAFLALYYALACGLYRRWLPQGTVGRVLLFAALWLLAELARGVLWTGFPWGAGGYAHVEGPLVPLARWVGVYGMGAVAAAGAMLLALWRGEWLKRSALYLALAVAGAVLLTLSWQRDLALLQAGGGTSVRKTVEVALLQGNIPQDEKFQPGSGVPLALEWYGQQLASTQARLVVAPETAIPVLLKDVPPNYWQALEQRFARGEQAALIGVPLGNFTEGYTNSMVALSPAGGGYRYDKHHLVPFGEFIPPMFRWFTDLMNIPLGDFNRGGVGQASFAWAGERWAPNICYEDLFGEELAARFVDPAQAPTVLVNASNIAWFGDSIAIDQHLAISRMRALELERPMLRATNTGATAVIDYRGEVQQQLPHQSRGVLTAQVEGRDAAVTPYAWWAARLGLWPLWLLGFGLAAVLAWGRRRQGSPAP
ncbi:MAG: apolipoprotein N-acyltransferase [Comamonas sp.]